MIGGRGSPVRARRHARCVRADTHGREAGRVRWALLADLPEESQREILSRCHRRRYGRRQYLFHLGDPSDGMHLIALGHVTIRVTTPLGDVASLALFGPGEALGEQSLLADGGVRGASAVAVDPVETLYLSRQVFEELRVQHPGVDRFLAVLLNARVQKLTGQLTEALYVPTTRRVLRRLVEAVDAFGGGTVPLTQEDIASMAGTTRPTANRVLREAEKGGAVRLSRGRIEVVDADLLQKLSR